MTSLGEKVRQLRKAKGWSQQQLAEQALTTVKTIRRTELNQTVPHQSTLERIAVALGVTPNFFDDYLPLTTFVCRYRRRTAILA